MDWILDLWCGAVRIDGELVLKRFVARNLRPITPVAGVGDAPMEADPAADAQPAAVAQAPQQAQPSASESQQPGGIIEYPEGAPPEVICDLKQPDPDAGRNLKRSAPSSGSGRKPDELKIARPTEVRASDIPIPPPGSFPNRPPLIVQKKFSVFPKAPKCPACQSGMEAPGIRRNAECKRKRVAFEQQQESSNVRQKHVHDVDGDFDFEMEERSELTEEGPAPAGGHGLIPTPLTRHERLPAPVGFDESGDRGNAAATSSEIGVGRPDGPGSGVGGTDVPGPMRGTGGMKRNSDVPVEDLEHEMEEERARIRPRTLDLFLMDDACESLGPTEWCLEQGPEQAKATSSAFYDLELNSVKFAPKRDHTCAKVRLGGTEVLLWKPDEVIDDSSLMQLNADLGFEGMREELGNLEKCKAGKVISQREVENFQKKHAGLRIIPSRWVAAYKSESRVRVRIVAKDIARGISARALGISSPTPSIEGLHFLLSLSAQRGLRLKSLDVSHAFMHSPLPPNLYIILKLPQSVSLHDGSPAFLLLYKALNGLRDASLHWLNLLSDSIRKIGLTSDEIEPCIYQGVVHGESALLMAYVDDLLLCTSSEKAEKVIETAIGSVVPLKQTGVILPAEFGGGSLIIIGRHISRGSGGNNSLLLGVDPKFLNTTFAEFNINKGCSTMPDIAAILDKSIGDRRMQEELTPSAYSRFRRALGKLLWMAQTRRDLKLNLSPLGSQQAKPNQGTEHAMRALLRFLHDDVGACLRLPSPKYEELMVSAARHSILHAFSDASHAPYRFNNRRGISGGVVFAEGSLVRSIARQQQSVSLSSCEAELYALQMVAQESVAFSKFCHRIYLGLGEMHVHDVPHILLESDSSSALQLLVGQDIPKRSRRIEIRMEWLKAKVAANELVLEHRAGTDNVADLFTKCLPTKAFLRHRASLGFEFPEVPTKDLQGIRDVMMNERVDRNQDLAFIEVCCGSNSALREACKVARMPYLGIVRNMESPEMFSNVRAWVEIQQQLGYKWVHVHASTPCSSGSPLKNFSGGETQADRSWKAIMTNVSKYLGLGDSKSFELPRNNNIWKRPETKQVLEQCGLQYNAEVFLCQTGLRARSGYPIGKCLIFCSASANFCNVLTKKFGWCECEQHASLDETNWKETGTYNKELAKAILMAVRAGRRNP